ncbi:ERF family protein [Henriciella sp.]|uniref:ERF family protein n=1 Tax=Henriciella sp. TaxID=1968823 RepID=UPI00261ED258|nr:ERF family protein [Henriciella sp.]
MPDSAMIEKKNEVAVREEATAFVSMIERAATNPEVDVEKMERLYAMHEKMQARQAETTFSDAFAEMQPNLPAIEKKGTSHHGAYAKWEDIQDKVLPVTSRYGFSISHKTRVENGQVIVTCILRHRDGHSDSTDLPLPPDKSGSKNDLQAVASAVSYGKRYTACALLGIRVAGEDNDGNVPQSAISAKQVQELRQGLVKAGRNEPDFIDFLNSKGTQIEELADLTAKEFETARQWLVYLAKQKGSEQ